MRDVASQKTPPQPNANRNAPGLIDPDSPRARLDTRRTVLHYFSQRRRFDHTARRRWESNGDVVCDILLAHRHKRLPPPPGGVSNDMRHIVQYLYGVSDLLRGHEYPLRMNLYNPVHKEIRAFHDCVYDNFVENEPPANGLSFQESIDIFASNHRKTHSMRAVRGVVGASTILLESQVMIAILNARGTVLLNGTFGGGPEQVQIINLATLAVDVYHGIVPGLDASLGIHFLALIRDEVGSLMLSAIVNFNDDHRKEQSQHMDVFFAEFCAWRQWQNFETTNESFFRTAAEDEAFKLQMQAGRVACNARLAMLFLNSAALVDTVGRPMFEKTSFDHHAEYTGIPYYTHHTGPLNLELEELYYPWLEKRSGRWFGETTKS